MIFLYIIAGLLVLILLLLCLPVQVELLYKEQLSLKVRYLFIPFQIMPKKEKSSGWQPKSKAGQLIKRFWDDHCAQRWDALKRQTVRFAKKSRIRLRSGWKWLKQKLGIKPKQSAEPAQTKPQEKEKSSFAQLREARGFSGMIALLWRVVSLAGGAFGRVMRGITVRRFDIFIRICGDDAAETATSYGQWCAVLYPALSLVLGSTRSYKKNIDIAPDFSGGETRAEADVRLLIMPLLAVIHAAGALLKMLWLEIKDAVKQKMDDASQEAANASNEAV